MLQHDAFVGMALLKKMHGEFSYANRVNESRDERRTSRASLGTIAGRYRSSPMAVEAHL
jgi:hypothetical protein